MPKTIFFLLFLIIQNSLSQENQQALVQLIRFNELTGSMVVEYPRGVILKETSTFTFIDSLGNSCDSTLLDVEGNRGLFSSAQCTFDGKMKPGKMLKLTSNRNLMAEIELVKLQTQKTIAMAPLKERPVVKKKNEKINKIKKRVKKKKAVRKKEQNYIQRNEENWYINIGLSYAMSTKFTNTLGTIYNDYDETYSFSGTPLIFDSGLYFPKKDGTILSGVSLIYALQSSAGESELANATFSHSSLLINYSLLKFFGGKPGLGVYIRGDMGIAFMTSESTQEFASNNITDTYSYSPGLGFHFETGYGFGLSKGMSALVGLGWTRSQATLDNVSTENSTDSSIVETEYSEDVSHSVITLTAHLFF